MSERSQPTDYSRLRRGHVIPISASVLCSKPVGVSEPVWNMAIDQAIFENMVHGRERPAVRLYTWNAPAITIGRFQTMRNLPAIESSSLPLARRMTGGRGILHGDDLTITLALPMDWLGMDSRTSVSAIYKKLGRGFLRAFSRCGIPAEMGHCRAPGIHDSRGNCMEIASKADIIDARTGQKLMGSALRKSGTWVLQQTSIPLRGPGFTAQQQLLEDAFGPSSTSVPWAINALDPEVYASNLLEELTSDLVISFSTANYSQETVELALAITAETTLAAFNLAQ